MLETVIGILNRYYPDTRPYIVIRIANNPNWTLGIFDELLEYYHNVVYGTQIENIVCFIHSAPEPVVVLLNVTSQNHAALMGSCQIVSNDQVALPFSSQQLSNHLASYGDFNTNIHTYTILKPQFEIAILGNRILQFLENQQITSNLSTYADHTYHYMQNRILAVQQKKFLKYLEKLSKYFKVVGIQNKIADISMMSVCNNISELESWMEKNDFFKIRFFSTTHMLQELLNVFTDERAFFTLPPYCDPNRSLIVLRDRCFQANQLIQAWQQALLQRIQFLKLNQSWPNYFKTKIVENFNFVYRATYVGLCTELGKACSNLLTEKVVFKDLIKIGGGLVGAWVSYEVGLLRLLQVGIASYLTDFVYQKWIVARIEDAKAVVNANNWAIDFLQKRRGLSLAIGLIETLYQQDAKFIADGAMACMGSYVVTAGVGKVLRSFLIKNGALIKNSQDIEFLVLLAGSLLGAEGSITAKNNVIKKVTMWQNCETAAQSFIEFAKNTTWTNADAQCISRPNSISFWGSEHSKVKINWVDLQKHFYEVDCEIHNENTAFCDQPRLTTYPALKS